MHSSLVCSRSHLTNADMDNMYINLSIFTTTLYGGQYFPSWAFWRTINNLHRCFWKWVEGTVTPGWSVWRGWPDPPTQSAALQLLQSSQHSTSRNKDPFEHWMRYGLFVELVSKLENTNCYLNIYISCLDRSVSMLSTWKNLEKVFKWVLNDRI